MKVNPYIKRVKNKFRVPFIFSQQHLLPNFYTAHVKVVNDNDNGWSGTESYSVT